MLYRLKNIFFSFLFLTCVVVAVDHASWSDTLRKSLQIDSVGTGVLSRGPLGKILNQLNLIKIEKNDFERFKKTDDYGNDLELITFQKKRQVSDFLYTINDKGKYGFTSSLIEQPAAAKKGWPIISLAVDTTDLYDSEHGLFPNALQKGKAWEKAGEVTYFVDGRIVFATSVGIRMHGGLRLETRKWKPGFKLYFRDEYGLNKIRYPSLLADINIPLKTLVVQTTDWPPGYPLNNPLAYDIVNRLGGIAPQTQLVEIYLNGQPYSMGYLTEHLSRRQWGQRFGHKHYSFYKYRDDNSLEDDTMLIERLVLSVQEKQKLTAKSLRKKIDIDNFSRYVFSWVFCGTTDFCQGVAALDSAKDQSTLFFINWDMDHSFYDYSAVTKRIQRPNWQQEAFNLIFNKNTNCLQAFLFYRLMTEDEEYKNYFINLVQEILNHRLTESYLMDRVEYYQQMLADYGMPYLKYIDMLKEFMKNRSGFILNDLKTFLPLAGPFSCRVIVPEGRSAVIDGYPYSHEYSGRYFENYPISIQLTPDNDKLDGYWRINDQKYHGADIRMSLEKDTVITYVTEER